MTETQYNPSPLPRERSYTWFGYLADDNIEHIAMRIRNILEGRRYSWTFHNADLPNASPELKTSLRLTDGVKVHRMGEPDYDGKPREYAYISFPNGQVTCGFNTLFKTEAEFYADVENAKRGTYFVIEGGRTPDDIGRQTSIKVKEYNFNSPRELLHTAIVPERNDDGEY
jgi:hypothetical protein